MMERRDKILRTAGVTGLIAAVLVAAGGIFISARATGALSETLAPIAAISQDVAEAIDATASMMERTTEAIISIEDATRSAGRTLASVSESMTEAADLIGEDVANSLDDALDAFPAIISAAAVIDSTMRALSFLGVDYDVEVPLDESLTELEQSLSPIPDQMRTQSEAILEITDDIDSIVDEAGALAAILLETRIEMLEAQRILESASENAQEAVQQIRSIENDVDSYGLAATVVALLAAVGIAAGAATPLILTSGKKDEPAEAG